MQRTLISHALLIVVLCLVAGAAFGGECKKIQARYSIDEIFFECTYDSFAYQYCVDAQVQGNLRGIWHVYGAPAFNGWPTLTVPNDALGIPGWDAGGFWNLSVIETKHGELFMRGNDWVNWGAYSAYGAYSSTFFVIGGTGKFEGATGWLGGGGDEVTLKGVFFGEVCTP